MALDTIALPYGLRDIKLTAYSDSAGTTLSNTTVDLPNARTLSFSDTEEFNELRGDDRVVATHGNGTSCEWELEAGGLSFEAFKIMAGGTVTDSGITPNRRRIFAKKVTDQRPYFKIEGQAISDSGGDVHVELHRCKATGELSGEFSDGEFFLTSADGVALALPNGPTEDEIYRFTYNESIVSIPDNGVLPLVQLVTPTGQGASKIVTVVGDHFTGATQVTFNGVAGTALTVVSDELINITIPAGSAGTTPVVVTTPVGTSAPVNYTRVV